MEMDFIGNNIELFSFLHPLIRNKIIRSEDLLQNIKPHFLAPKYSQVVFLVCFFLEKNRDNIRKPDFTT